VNRRAFVTGLGALLAAPLAVEAQHTGAARVSRVGFLGSAAASANPRGLDAFRQALREHGWLEGQNLVIDYRYAEGRFERLPALAAELVGLKADVMVAVPTPAAVAARTVTRTIPIVMVGVGDPVNLGLIASLAHPGGNVTGLSLTPDLDTFGKGLELLREAVPFVRRVALLINPDNVASALSTINVRAAAVSLRLAVQLMEARAPERLDAAFVAMTNARADALFILADPLFFAHRTRLAQSAARNRLPTVYGLREHVEAGGLMSYGPSLLHLYRQAAIYVDKILRGAQPANLPVEQPTKFELVINLTTTKALGLTIPPSLLLRADQVIE
jgi:putative ABC transport system substrate-binding protein